MADTIDWHKNGGTTVPDLDIPDSEALITHNDNPSKVLTTPKEPELRQGEITYTIGDIVRRVKARRRVTNDAPTPVTEPISENGPNTPDLFAGRSFCERVVESRSPDDDSSFTPPR